ncbi:MAG: YbaB/EbfC family nucleoid-associated protein [Acholeplasmatales bacterium]|nr:YbaB/EbfC family nucleoid-associated protein [Acholeplasmatales bacterium]
MNQQQMMRLKKMQKQMMEAQEKLESSEFVGTAGGVVSVTVKGNHEVVKVSIDKEAIEDDLEMVEDMLCLALNDANKKIEAESQKLLGGFGGLGLGF